MDGDGSGECTASCWSPLQRLHVMGDGNAPLCRALGDVSTNHAIFERHRHVHVYHPRLGRAVAVAALPDRTRHRCDVAMYTGRLGKGLPRRAVPDRERYRRRVSAGEHAAHVR